ncbi:MAG: FAD:protein FMN transferase [Planctomycetota bacterium]
MTWTALGLRHELILYGDNRARMAKLCLELKDASLETERTVGAQSGSELEVVNDFATTAKIRVSPTLYTLLLTAKHLWRQTDGRYEPVRTESQAASDTARSLFPLRRLELNPQEGTVCVRGEPIRLELADLGAGWLHDQLLRHARREQIRSGILISGERHVTALGPPPWGETWPLRVSAELHEGRRLASPLRFASGVLTACRRSRSLAPEPGSETAWPVAVATASGLEGVAFARSTARIDTPEMLAELASKLGGHGVWLARLDSETIEAYRPMAS